MRECENFSSCKLASIYLYGNPTTGYSWQYNIKNECIAKVVCEDYIPDDSKNGECGVGGTYIWLIRGLRPGRTEIMFNYGRPWENTVLKYVTYVINVDSRLNVTVRRKCCK